MSWTILWDCQLTTRETVLRDTLIAACYVTDLMASSALLPDGNDLLAGESLTCITHVDHASRPVNEHPNWWHNRDAYGPSCVESRTSDCHLYAINVPPL